MSDKEVESTNVAANPNSISDRERFKLETKSPVVNQQELRKKLLNPTKTDSPSPIQTKLSVESKDEVLSDEEVIVVPKGYKDYVCDKCAKCMEFEAKSKKDTACLNCGCELLYHLRDADESPTEDDFNEEWHDSDEEDD